MKKFLIVLAAIFVLAVVGIGFVIATFDVDKYRPMVTDAAQNAIGRPVTLGKLKLGWDNGIAVQARQFAILESESDKTPLVEVEQVSALVRLQPLLRKQVEVASVVIERPVIRASRDAQGTINLLGPAATASPVAAPSAAAGAQRGSAAAPMGVEIDSVRIEKGTVIWRDAMANPPKEITLNQLDVEVEDIAPARPMDLNLNAALGSDRQNVSVTGRVALPSGPAPMSISELHVQLTQVPLELFLPPGAVPVPVTSLNLSIPQLTGGQPADIRLSAAVGSDQPNVELSARVTLPAGQTPLTVENIALKVTDPPLQAFLPKGSQPLPVKSVELSVAKFTPGQPLDVSARAAVGANQPNVDFKGRVTLPAPPATGSVQGMVLNVRQLDLAAIAPPPKTPNDPKLRGTVSLNFEGTLGSLDPAVLRQQLSGKGHLRAPDIVIENLNVVREVLNKLSLIPRLGERTRSKLPPEYQAKLDAKDTVLHPIDTALSIDYGVLHVPDLTIQSDSFAMAGFSPVSLTPPVHSTAWVRLDKDLSAVLISSLNELQGMTTPAGELVLPVILTDTAPLNLDVQQIAGRLIQNTVGNLLGDLINKNAPQQPQPAPAGTPASQGQPAPQSSEPPSGEELIGQFLQRVLQPPPQQDQAQPQ